MTLIPEGNKSSVDAIILVCLGLSAVTAHSSLGVENLLQGGLRRDVSGQGEESDHHPEIHGHQRKGKSWQH